MQNSNLYFTIFQKISEHLTILLNIQSKKKVVRPPKVSCSFTYHILHFKYSYSWDCSKINFSVKIKYTKSKNGMLV
jgi:hypothetical protein